MLQAQNAQKQLDDLLTRVSPAACASCCRTSNSRAMLSLGLVAIRGEWGKSAMERVYHYSYSYLHAVSATVTGPQWSSH